MQQNKTKKAKHILEQGLYAHKGYGVLYESLTSINVAMAREAYSKASQIDLKSSTIRIASLSLSSNKSQVEKNIIVISKIDKPVVEEKRVDWESMNVNKYLSHYGKDFWSATHNLKSWSARKRLLAKSKTGFSNLSVLLYPKNEKDKKEKDWKILTKGVRQRFLS